MASRHFESKEHTKLYQQYRVKPPPQLIDGVMTYLKDKYKGELNVAVDIGCGSGQNTYAYAPHFKKVIGLDISPNQIAVANEHNDRDNVVFEVAPAEDTKLAESSVQLITVMAAAHWLDLPKFFEESLRVLSPGGVLAIYVYTLNGVQLNWQKDPTKTSTINQVFMDCCQEKPLSDFWPPETDLVLRNYRDITIPYEDFVRDETTYFVERRVSLAELVAEMQTWSGYQRMREKLGDQAGQDFLDDVRSKILHVIINDLNEGDERLAENIYFDQRFPFILLIARKAEN